MYLCSVCNYASATKIGKCPDCGSFWTFELDPTSKVKKKSKHTIGSWAVLEKATPTTKQTQYTLSMEELSRLFPHGVKSWGVYLLAGEPGIGKSTLMLQLLNDLSVSNKEKQFIISYFSGEESSAQINERQQRITKQEHSAEIHLFHSTHLEDIIATAEQQQTSLMVIDSIQTIYSTAHDSIAWSASQVKYCSEKIAERCKKTGTSCFIIGHVTKWGEIAWPKYLEHIVDAVLYLEWDKYGQYRFLRYRKNRFWSTDEVGIFEMWLFGLQPVYDLKERIISAANSTIPGNVFTVGIDNGRPVLVNIEVLLNKSYGKYPQRITQSIDPKRLQLIAAILDRYLKLNLSFFDIYVNIPGEFQFRDSWLDLALATAIYAQAKNKLIDKELIFVGELGLGWQILPSKLHTRRIKEAKDFTIIDKDRIKNIVELPHVL